MIKIPLRDLEEALTDPVAYVRKRKNPPAFMPRPGKFMTLRNAAFQYHKNGGDLSAAQDYLEEKFGAFKDQRNLPYYTQKLDAYVREFRQRKGNVVKTRDNLALTLPDEYAGFVVSGQASRIDLRQQGGYSVWTFARNKPNWRTDPRMPLLQEAYADRLAASLDEVEVGVYDFWTETYDTLQFSSSEVRAARRRLLRLLDAFI
jgi:hypothetical protein